MPFKSKAQRRKFAELLVKGEITPEAYERWNQETGRTELPERVKKTKARAKKSGVRKSAARKKGSARKKSSARKKQPRKRTAASRKR